MKHFLIIKTGSTHPAIARRRGDFESWFIDGLGLEATMARVVDVAAGQALPEPLDRVQAVLVTGSHAMVTDEEPWSERTARWLARVVEADIPTLGICYGHQLLAHALGGVVGRTPGGRESGTVEVRFLPEATLDPLLTGLGESAPLNTSHGQSVLEPPQGAVILAASPQDPNHAMRVAPRAWGLQFHPEFDQDIMESYLRIDADLLRADGKDPEALLKCSEPTPLGPVILRRFAAIAGLR